MSPDLIKFFKSIPLLIYGLVGAMILLVAWRWWCMHRQSRSLAKAFQELSDLVTDETHEPDVRQGLSLDRLEQIRSRVQDCSESVRQWWHRIEHQLEPYQGKQHFLARPAKDVLPEAELFEAMYDGAKYQAFPGILTSLGLAGTFMAILMGLFHVTYNQADTMQPVKGIEPLINSLSGKFTSSIVALGLSIFFIFREKRAEKRNRLAYDRMITRVEDAIPLLTPVRILVDLQASAVQQEKALRNISSEMVTGLRDTFTRDINPALSAQFSQNLMEGLQPALSGMTGALNELRTTILKEAVPLLEPIRTMADLHASAIKQEAAINRVSQDMVAGLRDTFTRDINPALSAQFSQNLTTELQPTLQRMTETLGGLKDTIRELETTKQGAMLAELTAMIQAMHGAIVESLRGMGSEFHSALSGATQQELNGMQQTMESARSMLEDTTRGFETMQQTFRGVVGQQVELLNGTVEDLVGRVGRMGGQIVESLGAAQMAAQEQTQTVIQRMSAVTENAQRNLEGSIERTHTEVAQMLAAVGDGTKGFGLAVDKLTRIQGQMEGSLERQQEGMEALASIGPELNALAGRFREIAGQVEVVVKTQGAGVKSIESQVKQLQSMQEGGGALLKSFAETFGQTQARMGGMDQDLAKAFGVIHEGMQAWTLSVEACLQSLTKGTNEHLASISRTFSRQIEDLGEKLESFGDALDRVIQRTDEVQA